ncbi:MAG: hypothetical protein K2Y01_04505 [Rhabdochlamydiaceae bacterium]|nr:hypothetical protein [Rhabdochlamydiaceae bacterium]
MEIRNEEPFCVSCHMSGSNWTPTQTALAILAGLVTLVAKNIIQNAAATVAAFEKSHY